MNISEAVAFALKTALEAGNSDAEAVASVGSVTNIVMERSEVRLGKSEQFSPLGIRVLRGKSQGFAATNVISRPSIKRCVAAATAIARVSPADPFVTIPSGTAVKPLEGIYDESIPSIESSVIFEKAAAMLDFIRSYDSRIRVDGGSFSVSEEKSVIMNSNGRVGEQAATLTSWELIGMAVEGDDVSSFDVAEGSSHFFKKAQPDESLKEFCSTVVSSLKARKAESFRGTVILRPDSAAEILVSPLISSSCALSVQKGRSPLAGKIGQQLSAETLTISDDGTYVDGPMASGFDREGTATRRTTVLDRGVLTAYLHSCYTAARDSTDSTANASGSSSSPPGNGPSNTIVAGGSQPLDSLVRETANGIFVNRFSGNVDPMTGEFSGVVKGGYLIRHGEMAHPVKETLIAGNVYHLLNSVSGLSKERKFSGNCLLPYLKVENVSII